MNQDMNGWIPYRMRFLEGEWLVNWLDLDNHHINEPFFDETIDRCRIKMSGRSRFKTASNLQFLLAAAPLNSIPPTAFIFHVSRCGSTLLSQALASEKQNIVIAEAPILDEILRAQEHDKFIGEAEVKEIFMSAVAFMGQIRNPFYKHYFIKLDSWHLHFYHQLRSWYPDTPFYFLSREPEAIISSHQKRRGLQSIPGMIDPRVFKINLSDAHFADFNSYTAEVLAGYYNLLSTYIDLQERKNHFYDYAWGVEGLLQHFHHTVGIAFEKSDPMNNRLAFHSKYPDQPFTGDQATNQKTFYPVAQEAYQQFYNKLKQHG
ncbi:hypothetical protein [Pedobacter endophyticus]|uniref:Sulfotransferase family protein n=1 Tax=Pedobacter endophyticus TaxID=2789740 RepID=A0A7U3Q4Z1_9SPHI|nr:hypothetical protein [Pedobacter endophyticus]QPH37837.1 hypothetical protein IZT61_12015 [Pedobacter endophyticus]